MCPELGPRPPRPVCVPSEVHLAFLSAENQGSRAPFPTHNVAPSSSITEQKVSETLRGLTLYRGPGVTSWRCWAGNSSALLQSRENAVTSVESGHCPSGLVGKSESSCRLQGGRAKSLTWRLSVKGSEDRRSDLQSEQLPSPDSWGQCWRVGLSAQLPGPCQAAL